MDIIKINPNENIFTKPVSEPMKQEKFPEKNKDNKKKHAGKKDAETSRLNDYDSNLMEEYAYMDLTDDVLKLEFNISMLEKKLDMIDSEIKTLEGLDAHIKLSDLRFKRDLIEAELTRKRKQYEKLSFSAGISYHLSKFITKLFRGNIIRSCADFIFRYILPLCSQKYRDSVMVKDALTSLDNINSRVDELIKMKSPYGEIDDKYEKLTAFLNQANYLQAKIISAKKK